MLQSLAIAASDPVKVDNAREMFEDSAGSQLDLRNLDMSGCVSTKSMFDGCSNLEKVLQHWDLRNVRDAEFMFINCKKLTHLDTSNWNLSKLEDAQSMFENCCLLTELDSSKWNLSTLQNAENMFGNCQALTQLDTSNWNLSQLENTRTMFGRCGITTLDTTNWNLSNLNCASQMFASCSSLSSIIGSGNWDLSQLQTAAGMFASCPSLTRGRYAYDFCDTGMVCPLAKMYTLGSNFSGSGLQKLTINGQAFKKLADLGAVQVDRTEYGEDDISEFYEAIMTFTGSVQGDTFVVTGLEKYRSRDGQWEYPEVEEDVE